MGKKSGKKRTIEEYNIVAKSDCGLPANSAATVQLVSREEYEIRYDRAFGKISRSTYYRRLRKLMGRRKSE